MVNILFNSVKREDAALVMNKKGTPNGHSSDAVIFRLSTLFKEKTNVISEWTGGVYGTTRFSK